MQAAIIFKIICLIILLYLFKYYLVFSSYKNSYKLLGRALAAVTLIFLLQFMKFEVSTPDFDYNKLNVGWAKFKGQDGKKWK